VNTSNITSERAIDEKHPRADDRSKNL